MTALSGVPAAREAAHAPSTTAVRLRAAAAEDAERIAQLHTDSWRRHYRGA